jgi:2EXR family
MIWEFTWPPPRIIEATYYEDLDAEEFRELTVLRLGGSLSTFLNAELGSRILQDKPLEDCQSPVALRVCNESRRHTLKKYIALRHAEYNAGSFFFSPDYDILWLSQDCTDESQNIEEIKDYYGDQLSLIKNVLVEEIEWSDITAADYIEKHLYPLDRIQNLFILFGSIDETGRLELQDTKELLSLVEYYRNEYARFADRAAEQNSGVAKHIKFITSRDDANNIPIDG